SRAAASRPAQARRVLMTIPPSIWRSGEDFISDNPRPLGAYSILRNPRTQGADMPRRPRWIVTLLFLLVPPLLPAPPAAPAAPVAPAPPASRREDFKEV